MLSPKLFQDWINYFRDAKLWRLEQSTIELLYRESRPLDDNEFQAICTSLLPLEHIKPESLINKVRERANSRATTVEQLPPGNDLDPAGEGRAFCRFMVEWVSARRKYQGLPKLTQRFSSDYGAMLGARVGDDLNDRRTADFYRQLQAKYGSWASTPSPSNFEALKEILVIAHGIWDMETIKESYKDIPRSNVFNVVA